MILASCRKGFDSTLALGPLQFLDHGASFSVSEITHRLAGKRVCILVHGYHVDMKSALDAYGQIEKRIPFGYDELIGFLWPGSPIALGFFPAISRATESGQYLAQLAYELSCAGCTVDIETHSLGARVALKAIDDGVNVRNLILTAPAVDDGVLRPGGEFGLSVCHANRVAVLYSKNDPVLRYAYFAAELILEQRSVHALGLDGPESPAPANVSGFDLSESIHGHGEYKDCPKVYEIWRGLVNG